MRFNVFTAFILTAALPVIAGSVAGAASHGREPCKDTDMKSAGAHDMAKRQIPAMAPNVGQISRRDGEESASMSPPDEGSMGPHGGKGKGGKGKGGKGKGGKGKGGKGKGGKGKGGKGRGGKGRGRRGRGGKGRGGKGKNGWKGKDNANEPKTSPEAAGSTDTTTPPSTGSDAPSRR